MRLTCQGGLFLVFFAVLSCRKEEQLTNEYDSESIKGAKFMIESARIEPKLDLNGDGIASENFLEELRSEINPTDLRLTVSKGDDIDRLNWVWPMTVVTTSHTIYIEDLPSEYSSDMKINYRLNALNFKYILDKGKQIIVPSSLLLDNIKLTYQKPDKFTLDKGKGRVYFSISQKFMTSKGLRTSIISGYYKQVEYYPDN